MMPEIFKNDPKHEVAPAASADTNQALLVFCVLAAPFYLNDFGFMAANGSYAVYLIDYGTRASVLAVALIWPLARMMSLENTDRAVNVVFAATLIVGLPVLSRLSYHLIEIPFVQATDIKGLFNFPDITDPALYWLDLSAGLFLVALSEELIFRKLAWRFLHARGYSPVAIVVLSALLFSLIHWASGPARLIGTFVIGMLFMIAYLRIKALWPLVAAHWITNFLAFGPFDL